MSIGSVITVVNKAPGMHRAGVTHPAVKSYSGNHFTPEQLLILIREPQFTVVVGHVLTEDDLVAEIGKEAAAKAKAEAGKKA